MAAGWQVAYWRQPLTTSSEEFTAAGFLIERIHEPRPSTAMHQRYPQDAAWSSDNPGFVVFPSSTVTIPRGEAHGAETDPPERASRQMCALDRQ